MTTKKTQERLLLGDPWYVYLDICRKFGLEKKSKERKLFFLFVFSFLLGRPEEILLEEDKLCEAMLEFVERVMTLEFHG
jgi:hypothetical protein